MSYLLLFKMNRSILASRQGGQRGSILSSGRLPTRPIARRTSFAAGSSLEGTGPLQFREVQVSETALLRASSYLRAASFFVYPGDRSEFVARSHRRMKADDEWEALEAKMAQKDKIWKGILVHPIVALRPFDPSDPTCKQLDKELDRSSKVPGEGSIPPQIVVATLDVNVGSSIPSEELVGALPSREDGNPDRLRGYFSNVCVAPAVRKQGLGKELVRRGEELARRLGIRHLYVHVIASNEAGVNLYKSSGFTVEVEETENLARGLDRPRRLLLRKDLV